MHKSQRTWFEITCILLGALMLLIGCGGSDSSVDAPIDSTNIQENSREVIISGFAQKGPLQKGSSIEIYELDDAFNQTGVSFRGKILNDYGEYNLQARLSARYIELYAEGYYFDEISAERSSGWVSLGALADTEESTTINANLLTTLAKNRMLALIDEGQTFSLANAQAKREVLQAFGITDETPTAFQEMNIFRDGDDNAKLLAVTAIMMQMAHFVSDQRTSAALSDLITTISDDLQDNGWIDDDDANEDIFRAIWRLSPVKDSSSAIWQISPAKVKKNIATRFPEMVVPDFDYIINDVINGYAYSNGNYKKYEFVASCDAGCGYIPNLSNLQSSILNQENYIMVINSYWEIMGRSADNSWRLSGSALPPGQVLFKLYSNCKSDCETNGYYSVGGTISNYDFFTGTISLRVSMGSPSTDISVDAILSGHAITE